MNKLEFFNKLEKALKARGIVKIDDILRDYEEYFIELASAGKTEDEIIASLDSPEEIALNYNNQNRNVKEEKKVLEYNAKIVKMNMIRYYLGFALMQIGMILIAIVNSFNIWGFIAVEVCLFGFLVLAIFETRKLKKIKAKLKEINDLEKKDI